jgi:hypothetical protein
MKFFAGVFFAGPSLSALAGGKLFVTTRTAGTYVIAAKPKSEQLAHNVIATDRTSFNATPTLAGRSLLLCSNEALYFIGGPAVPAPR